MGKYPLLENILLLKTGIDACIEKKAFIPALTLIYSAIDTTGWLDSKAEFATRDDFMRWVDKYLLKAKPLKCTAIDLYAARCGVLHTFTSASQLSSSGKANIIFYAWGKANTEHMQRIMDHKNTSSNHPTVVHIDELYQAWLLGLEQWGKDLDSDSYRSARVIAKAAKFFEHVSIETVSSILSII